MNREQPTRWVVDLHSDTATRPVRAMREAMAWADVGDEQLGEDPTTRLLEERVADLLGKEAAAFLCSGTMCNRTAVAALTRPGDRIVCDSVAHVLRSEAGGAAAVSGVLIEPVATERGHLDAAAVRSQVSSPKGSRYEPRTSLVWFEQTNNFAGGTVCPIETWREAAGAAHEAGIPVFVDGARLWNAGVATGVPLSRWAAAVDGLWVDFSKGLGAPMGGVIAGSAAFIEEVVRWKHVLGAALRQSGVVAAAALWALDHHVERLHLDHENARRLARGLAELGCDVVEPDTNIVFFTPPVPAERFTAGLAERGVRMTPLAGRVRAVTHLDVPEAGIDVALSAAREVLAGD